MTTTGSSPSTSSQRPHPRRRGLTDFEQSATADLSLAYRVGSSVLNRLPLYSRIWSYLSYGGSSPRADNIVLEEKVTIPAGVRTPPPGYYDISALTEEARFKRDSPFMMSAAGSGSGCCSSSLAPTAESDGTSRGGNGEVPESIKTGYFPDTGAKRLLRSFSSLLKTLSSEAPASDVISSWLPGAGAGAGSEDSEDSEATGSVVVHPMVVSHSNHTPLNNESDHGECSCFSCFQQRQMYLLWLQGQTHDQSPHFPVHHSTPLLCSSCQRPHLPPRPTKSLLHRFTAAVVLRLFTIALVLYPHAKSVLASSYAWERRNRVSERVLAAVLVLYECVWLVFLWLFKLSGVGATPAAGWGEVEEQRVRKWLVRTGGEVLGGVVDGMQMGVGVWGAEAGKGKGKANTRIVGVEN